VDLHNTSAAPLELRTHNGVAAPELLSHEVLADEGSSDELELLCSDEELSEDDEDEAATAAATAGQHLLHPGSYITVPAASMLASGIPLATTASPAPLMMQPAGPAARLVQACSTGMPTGRHNWVAPAVTQVPTQPVMLPVTLPNGQTAFLMLQSPLSLSPQQWQLPQPLTGTAAASHELTPHNSAQRSSPAAQGRLPQLMGRDSGGSGSTTVSGSTCAAPCRRQQHAASASPTVAAANLSVPTGAQRTAPHMRAVPQLAARSLPAAAVAPLPPAARATAPLCGSKQRRVAYCAQKSQTSPRPLATPTAAATIAATKPAPPSGRTSRRKAVPVRASC
jgi:hypothetical protein